MPEIQLIAGLGNPGEKYQQTRHNAGFWFIDALAKQTGAQLKPEAKFFGDVAKCTIEGQAVWLLKPATFMNLSGRSVSAFINYYKIPVENILVAHDELDFPAGMARLKHGGGHGGHNGLRDIIPAIGDKNFWRLRLGIGHPGDARQVTDYVLKTASASECQSINKAIDQALGQIDFIVSGEFERSMTALHTESEAN